MPQDMIFAPVGVMALITFVTLGMIPIRRFRAARAGQVTSVDFKLGESHAVPPDVVVVNRAYMNSLELPVLFYVASLMYFVSGRLDSTTLAIAWAYVALRAAHALIHVTYNQVMHRLIAFALSNLVLMVFWAMFFLR